MSTNAYLHAPVLYGQWEECDGCPLDRLPLFYNGLTESAANLPVLQIEEIIETKGADYKYINEPKAVEKGK